MKMIETEFKDLWVIEGDIATDNRGSFRKLYSSRLNEEHLGGPIRQVNFSFNVKAGTLRGMHFQTLPFNESKIVHCVSGSIFDVVVDFRPESLTYLKHFSIVLDSKHNKSLLIPRGFAHGFQTLEDNSIVSYLHSEEYKPGHDSGVNYLDPTLGIDWPRTVSEVSLRDQNLPMLDCNFEGIKL